MVEPPAKLPVIVYGANGFIGRNLCLALSDVGWETVAVSREFDPAFEARLDATVTCRQADFRDTEALFDKVVPADGATHILLVSDSVPSTYTQTPSREVSGNLLSHVRFFERLGAGDRVVFASSGGTVYGAPEKHIPLRETDAVAVPISAYGVTKLAIEKYLTFTARHCGFEHVTLRPSNPVGPWARRDATQGFIGVALANCLDRKPIRLWGDGSTTRDFIDVRDLSRAILGIIAVPELPGDVYNVGSGVGRSLSDVLESIRSTLALDPVIEMDDERVVDVPYNVLDASRLTQVTGWRPHIDFETTLRDTFAFISSMRSTD